jgi:hypothetical protein
MAEKLLTLRRMPDGTIVPHVDGDPLIGCIEVTLINTAKAVQLTFRTEFLLLDTAPNVFAEKMN